MGNCLVTKLKESVNNNRLVKMDEILVSFPASYNATVITQGYKPKVYNDNGEYIQELNSDTSGGVRFTPGFSGFLKINAKSVIRLGLVNCDFHNGMFCNFPTSSFLYMFSVRDSSFKDSVENIVAYIPNSNDVNISNTRCYGNLGALLDAQGNLKMSRLTSLAVKGNSGITMSRSTCTRLTALLSTFVYDESQVVD